MAALRTGFPDLLSCHTNIACAEGAVMARDAGIAVLEHYGGTGEDYLAAKYLVASQSLLLPGRSSGMVRAIVEALTPVVLAFPI
jgi:hypothetical protein